MKLSKYIREIDQGVTLDSSVYCRASRDEIDATPETVQLKVRVTAPPVDSAANKAPLKFIAKSLDVSPRTVTLVRSDKNRSKALLITDTNAASVLSRIHK